MVIDWLNVTKFLIILVFIVIFIWDSIVMFFAADLNATVSFAVYTIS